ncbi:MAG: E2/UBC family protein [Pyrinomonadaceae bacterium]
MLKEINTNTDNVLLDDAARGIELDAAVGGEIKKEDKARDVNLTARVWEKNNDVNFKAKLDDTLGEVLEKAGKALGEKILPPEPAAPLDLLRGRLHNGQWSDPITDLSQLLGRALKERFDKHFAVEYMLVVKINALWGISPTNTPTPRQLLAAFGMDASEFTLYPPDSSEPYPVDRPIKVRRGQKFEAQKDGRYGDGVPTTVKKPRGTQTIEDDVNNYNEAGAQARLLSFDNQIYVETNLSNIPSPPWSSDKADILIAIPATYPTGGLDAFYIKMPMGHASGDIPRKQNIVQIGSDQWLLISWHYHPSKPWNPTQDDLATHIEHCRGFFLTRGVRE